MSTILLVDDRAIFREPIAMCLRQNGYTTHTADNGRAALRVLAEHPPDLILLDVAMPEMDGIQFLHVLREKPEHKSTPVILLTAVSERGHVVEAARLGVRDYLLKSSFSLEEMLGRVRSRLADKTASKDQALVSSNSPPPPSGAAPALNPVRGSQQSLVGAPVQNGLRELVRREAIVTREELIRIVTKGLELKPLAPVVQSVIATTSSSHCSGEDVARAVAQDQALSIRVLRMANTTTYSRGRPMHSLKDAISRIGHQEVRQLVMAVGVLESYQGAISKYVDARLFWEHAVGCGHLAATLARVCGQAHWESLFLPGTLHDLGRLVLCEHVADKYAEVFKAAQDLQLPLETVETRLLLLDHCMILERALEHWHFPREFIAPVVFHHQPAQNIGRLKPEQARTGLIIALANRLAHALLIGSSGNDVIYPLADLMDGLHLDPKRLDEIIADVSSATDSLKCSVLSASNESGWPSMADKVSGWLHQPVRALCVCDTPGKDPYPLLFQRLGQKNGNPPNVAIVHLSDARNQPRLFDTWNEVEERQARLPAVIICQRGCVDTTHPVLHNRPHIVLRSPTRLEGLINAINQLLTGEP